MKGLSILALLLCISFASAGYHIVDSFNGSTFFNNFNFFSSGDPTHGYVYYANSDQAWQWNLVSVQNNVVYIRSDSSSVSSGSGRASVRIQSNRAYNKGLFIFDVAHAPFGCGTWPALWTVGPNWPNSGEIDVFEGVNQNNVNQMTLHTSAGCTMPANWNQIGKTVGTDCNGLANSNAGCGTQSPSTQSYGQGFNNGGGGVFAMQWEDSGIYIWFWPRNGIPGDILALQPNTAGWGTPQASFPFGNNCAAGKFNNHNIVVDNTFCGDWAGSAFGASGCPGSCESFVQNNPGSFREAYWAINSIRVYQQ